MDYERDCPKCGSDTEVTDEIQFGNELLDCVNDECNWCVEISGTGVI